MWVVRGMGVCGRRRGPCMAQCRCMDEVLLVMYRLGVVRAC